MTHDRQSPGSLSELAREYLRQANRAGMSATTFAQRLADAYHALVPCVDERVIELHAGTTADGQLRAMRLNGKIVERLCTGAIRFPLDLVEAWAQALPDALGLAFRRELARRLGFIGAEPPRDRSVSAGLGALASEFGETMQALAPLLRDGQVRAGECPALILRALREGTDLMAAWMSVQEHLIATLPDGVSIRGAAVPPRVDGQSPVEG